MVEVRQSVEIARPPNEVFAYMTDPAKLPTWQDAESVTQLTSGPVQAGTRFREIHKALGIRREEITEVVVCEPGRRFEIRVVEGPPIDGRWDFAPHGDGTRLTFTPLPHLPGPLKAAEPAAAFMTALVMGRFHRRLKRALEGAQRRR